MYLEGVGLRSIGRILGVSNVAVLYWVRHFGTLLKEYVCKSLPADIYDIDVVEMDEMWHFTKKKTKTLDRY